MNNLFITDEFHSVMNPLLWVRAGAYRILPVDSDKTRKIFKQLHRAGLIEIDPEREDYARITNKGIQFWEIIRMLENEGGAE